MMAVCLAGDGLAWFRGVGLTRRGCQTPRSAGAMRSSTRGGVRSVRRWVATWLLGGLEDGTDGHRRPVPPPGDDVTSAIHAHRICPPVANSDEGP